jgi:hypothetical protein
VLLERTFAIGGGLLLVFGALLLGVAIALGLAWTLFGIVLSGGVLIGFGVFFLRVGRDARRHRTALLALGEGPPEGPRPGDAPRP